MGVVAQLYHVHGLRQRDIGERLGISQARVSRLLQQAEAAGVVRTVVAVPEGLHPELEEELEQRFGLLEAHLVETGPAVGDLAPVLGRAAARYLGEAGLSGGVIGFTSWSRTLQEMAHALEAGVRPGGRHDARHVVEMLGDLGSPLLQHAAARSTQAMARALGAEPVFLRTPGVLTSPEHRSTVDADPHVARPLRLLDAIDVAFVGVGPAAMHSSLTEGDRYFTVEQLAEVRSAGAVGQINQRFLDGRGRPVRTPLDDLVVGSSLDQLNHAGRRVVVAGGDDKHASLAAALAGRWVDVLVTDAASGRRLLGDASP
jgi:DNA-binding transcriptional regulator LsrR (DeoR family)